MFPNMNLLWVSQKIKNKNKIMPIQKQNLPPYLQNSALSTLEKYLVVTIMRIPSI
jgi:hypothetical protein